MNSTSSLDNDEHSCSHEEFDHYVWLVKHLNIDTRNNREFNKFTKDYAFFKVGIMSDLLHKFNKQSKYDYDYDQDYECNQKYLEDSYEDRDYDYNRDEYDQYDQEYSRSYEDEAYRNYIQYKDLY